MSYKTGEFNPDIRSTRDFMEPIDLDSKDPHDAELLSDCLHKYGLALVKSQAFDKKVRTRFLKAVQDYYCSAVQIRGGDVRIEIPDDDLRKDLGYQYGPTPIGEEVALCSQHDSSAACRKFVDRLSEGNLPFTIPGSDYPDHKGRFMDHLITRTGRKPRERVGVLQADGKTSVVADERNIIPAQLSAKLRDSWREIMNEFGIMMLEPVTRVSQMLAKGLGLREDYFTSLMNDGHHKIAPTYASYWEDRKPGTVQAALHQDIDVFAIHAQGTHSGLFVYTENGERLEVRVPPGCFLVQAGRQLYLRMRSMERKGEITTRPIKAGWHEVVVTPDAVEKASAAIDEIHSVLGDYDLSDREKLKKVRRLYRECLRISCTLFYHFGDDTQIVYGLEDGFREEGLFPEGTKTQEYIGLELGFIKLQE